MKTLFALSFLCLTVISQAQTASSDFIEKAKKSDLSDLWTLEHIQIEDDTTTIKRPEPLGYIGDNYQRFYVRFISVIQDPRHPLEYMVYGKSMVKNNVCSFQGRLIIDDAQLHNNGDLPPLKQGFINGSYLLFEDTDHTHTGIFKGRFQTNFYINSKGHIKYDALMLVADGFKNNQFEGTWKAYGSTASKKCNWGDFRIPDSGDLDGGAGEFSPSQQYYQSDWLGYVLQHKMNQLDVSDPESKSSNTNWWKDE